MAKKPVQSGGAKANRAGDEYEKKIREDIEKQFREKGYRFKQDTEYGTLHGKLIYSPARRSSAVGIFLKGKDFVKFLSHEGGNYKDAIHKPWEPDGAFIDFRDRSVQLFEMKWQTSSGSVDEKLGAGEFKYMQFEKMSELIGYKIKRLTYVLCPFFADPYYDDYRDFYREKNLSNKIKLEIDDFEILDI